MFGAIAADQSEQLCKTHIITVMLFILKMKHVIYVVFVRFSVAHKSGQQSYWYRITKYSNNNDVDGGSQICIRSM